MTTKKILTTVKELSVNYTEEELREAYALAFDMNMRFASRGKEHKRSAVLKTILGGLIELAMLVKEGE